ncbi:Fibulin-1 [Blattella germanica]|nr:Fibulin-1 [Blattella germanica]
MFLRQLCILYLFCVDVNECEEGTHVCNLASEACLNEPGGYRCGKKNSTALSQCKPGFKYSEVTKTCIDDDECTLGTDNCRSLGPTWQCRNTLGSFRCERKRCEGKQILLITGECKPLDCPSGYEASRQGQCIGTYEL